MQTQEFSFPVGRMEKLERASRADKKSATDLEGSGKIHPGLQGDIGKLKSFLCLGSAGAKFEISAPAGVQTFASKP